MASIGGSGLDVQAIVNQLMTIERRPIRRIESKIDTIDHKISALGKLRSALSELKDAAAKLSGASSLGRFAAESSDENIVSAEVSSIDVEENHTITVKSLASRHRIAAKTIYQSLEDALPLGEHTYQVGDKSFTVTLTDDAATLKDLSNAINRSKENPGVNASIIHVDEGYRLVLSARESGTANTLKAKGDWEELAPARDASIVVDGLEIHPASNTVSDVIPGVTLTLKAEGEVNLTTRAEPDKIAAVLDEFADKYNALRKTLRDLGEGDLKGEGLSFSIENQLRNAFFNSAASDAEGRDANIFSYGLTFDKEGVLSVDKSKLRDVIGSDLNGFLDFFTSGDGFGSAITSITNDMTDSNGLLTSRKNVFNETKDRLTTRSDQLETRMDAIKQRYLQTYSQLDALMAQMNATSSRIGQSLGALVTNKT